MAATKRTKAGQAGAKAKPSGLGRAGGGAKVTKAKARTRPAQKVRVEPSASAVKGGAGTLEGSTLASAVKPSPVAETREEAAAKVLRPERKAPARVVVPVDRSNPPALPTPIATFNF